ncbi:MAG: hypothetical protein AMXMBFR66_34540 [Pseudomonadota bacterium]|nr:DUF488 family protein [Rubrivivax sp.]NLZ40790.1 DUF488 family protein [Comamonadaceae bacterium]
MTIRVVRLGSTRAADEGLRIGTVRRPPRGVPKSEFASRDWYDVWFPTLAPSPATIAQAHAARSEADWRAFAKAYRHEMTAPEATHALDLLAALSRQTDLTVGCYCERPEHCHRSTLAALLRERGAEVDERS